MMRGCVCMWVWVWVFFFLMALPCSIEFVTSVTLSGSCLAILPRSTARNYGVKTRDRGSDAPGAPPPREQ